MAATPPPMDLSPIVAVFANLSEMLRIPLEAAAGYRAQCEAAGFSPTAAEAMSEQFHQMAMSWLFAIVTKEPVTPRP